MIRDVAELLHHFVEEERIKLNKYKLAHGPTIGAMYEGLTKDLLKKAIPVDLGLSVVSGFVCNGEDLSGQIDCMLVSGSGELIPFTTDYKWPVDRVIAVFEVKKSLSTAELEDSYNHLRNVSGMYGKFIENAEAFPWVRMDWIFRVFSQITGLRVESYAEVSDLPFDKELLFHTLVNEYMEPARVVFALNGWKREVTLRENIYKLLERRRANPKGMGAGSFPHLVISGGNSLIKANGLPYASALANGMWPFLLSSNHNPIRILLEVILTKIDIKLDSNLAEDNSLERESMSACLSAKAVRRGARMGWDYKFHGLSEKQLKERGSSHEWAPFEITDAQHVAFMMLCRDGSLRIDDRLRAFAEKEGGVDSFVKSLVATQLVALRGKELVLISKACKCVVTPRGVYVADDHDGQLTNWILAERSKAQGPES